MAKAGRPTKYKKEYCQEVIELMAQGWLDYKIAAKWNISRDTYYTWRNEYKDFNEACKVGLAKSESWWADWGEKGMRGEVEGFDYKCWISFMNNKFRESGWARTDKPDAANTSITIGNMNVLNHYQNKSVEQLKDILLEKLGDQGIIEYQAEEIEYDHTQDSGSDDEPKQEE